MFAKQVDYNYNRAALFGIVQDLAEVGQLFKKPVPISALSRSVCKSILETLQIQYGQPLFNFTVTSITVACLKPFERSAIHKDSNEVGLLTPSALNLPLSSCNGVVMNWYSVKPNGTAKEIKSAKGWTIQGLSLDNAVKQFTFPCNEPFLVNPSEFHDIVNTTNESHLIISVR